MICSFGSKEYGISNEVVVGRGSTVLIRWIVIYPVGNAIQRLNNRGELSVHVTILHCCFTLLLFLLGPDVCSRFWRHLTYRWLKRCYFLFLFLTHKQLQLIEIKSNYYLTLKQITILTFFFLSFFLTGISTMNHPMNYTKEQLSDETL